MAPRPGPKPGRCGRARAVRYAISALLLLCSLGYVAYNVNHIAVLASTRQLFAESTSHANGPYSSHSHSQMRSPLAAAAALFTAARSPRVAILLVGDEAAAEAYAQHWASLRCYAARWGYTVLVETNNQTKFEACSAMNNFYFRKHCTVAQAILADMARFDFWLVLDGDVYVVNADTSLAGWLPSDPRIHVVQHERFHDGEIVAGNYLLRSSDVAVAYLMQWSRMHWTLEQDAQTNNDNGALHLHVVNWLHGNSTPHWHECRRAVSNIATMQQYDLYVGCIKCVLGRRRVWPDKGLQIVRRGHFPSRDYFVSSPGDGLPVITNIGMVGPGDVFFHGWKDDLVGVWWAEDVDEAACKAQARWTPKLLPNVTGSEAEVLQQIRLRDAFVITDRGLAVPITDVSECWPRCPAELTEAQEKQIRERTCPDGLREWYKDHPDL